MSTKTYATLDYQKEGFVSRENYHYHYGDMDASKQVELLKDTPEIEMRIRSLK